MSGLLPLFAERFERLRAELVRKYNVDIAVNDWNGILPGDGGATFRTESDTTRDMRNREIEYAAYAAKTANPLPINTWRPIAPYGKSFHNYGAAADWKIIKNGGRTDAAIERIVADEAPACGLRSGLSFNDGKHIEVALTLAEARQLYESAEAGRGSLHA